MKKKNNSKKKKSQNQPEEIVFTEETEAIFKKILRIMTWIVGLCFVLIIIFHLFNDKTMDIITRILFFIGIINLLVFTLLEFIGDKVKLKIQKITSADNSLENQSVDRL
ncbi:MAG: hypothetical protein D8M58_02465 [Calditrichaeota bacterium]|nr:MAG: hypothetical protein DWQ03_04615 [Calditrichota bacterium]MBL1204228.1 hypothetical protein [Calditrichota bacterium]NOG44058.1 hypothetical protein [Calditrichota bacterium]